MVFLIFCLFLSRSKMFIFVSYLFLLIASNIGNGKKYLVNISSSELWTTEVVDRGMLVLFEKRTQRTTGTILGWQSENTVFNIMPAYCLAKWIPVCLFVSVPQHFLVGGECQSSFDTFWWKLFLPGPPIIDSSKMHLQEKQHISEMIIIKRKGVKSLKFSPVTTVTEFSDNEKSGKRIFYLKSDFSMERIEVRSLKSCSFSIDVDNNIPGNHLNQF